MRRNICFARDNWYYEYNLMMKKVSGGNAKVGKVNGAQSIKIMKNRDRQTRGCHV